MRIEMTDEARRLLEKKGGTMSIDLIRPTGWGKVAEVSVDTNMSGKNVAAYRRLRHDGVRILVTPTLVGLADVMRVVTTGRRGRSLGVELVARSGQ